MPDYVVQKTAVALNSRKKSVNGSRILIVGLAYKENVDDMRESPTFHLMDGLKELGAEIDYYDPHIPEVIPTREHAEWTGKKSVELTAEALAKFDCVLIATDHARTDLSLITQHADLIVDTRNAVAKAGLEVDADRLFKA